MNAGPLPKQCSVPGCGRPHHAKGYCKAHYNQMQRRCWQPDRYRRYQRRWRRMHPGYMIRYMRAYRAL